MSTVKVETTATITLNAEELAGLATLLHNGVGFDTLSELNLTQLSAQLSVGPFNKLKFKQTAVKERA